MDRARQFFGKYLVNQALAFETGFAVKFCRNDLDLKMRFPTCGRAGMARMAMGFVDHRQILRRQSLFQFPRDRRCNRLRRHVPIPDFFPPWSAPAAIFQDRVNLPASIRQRTR